MAFESLEQKLGPEKFARFAAVAAQVELSSQQVVDTLAKDGIIVGRSAVLSRRKTIVAAPSPTPNAPISTGILLRENQRLKQSLATREAGWEIIRDVLNEVYSEPLNIAVATPEASKLDGSPEVAVFHVTDVHYGKHTPTYDIAVTEERMLRYFRSTSQIVGLRREVAPIDEALVLLGGDMIEGEGIFPHQAWETQVDLIEQMVKGGPEYCVNLLLSIAQLFPVVRVHAVPGNHGRQGRFMSPRTNADSVFYEIVRKMVQVASPETAARIVWDLPLDRQRGDQWYSRFNIIGDWEGMLVHGDQIQGQLGFPWYGFGKKVNGWRNANGTRGFTHLWSGHFHTHASFDLNDATVLSTGSPESSNGYALENMAAAGVPKQRLTFFNARYGLLSDAGIFLG